MKTDVHKKWKQFKVQARRKHSRRLEGFCANECEHLQEKAADILERSGYEKARKYLDRYERCTRSCFIRRSETGYSKAGKRWAKYTK